ncbi:MAG: polyisoprenyl-phosphate glycosyltransferase [Acidobacteriaceae bacterium]|jgi:GT2 family glycosyltransferase|nr:polyisoprenyl-phosphate glycosyltransferase [Acidobacteriaceae bacterium]
MVTIGKYEYEHIFIDNSSQDTTVSILKTIAAEDKNVKIIVNSRNFGTSARQFMRSFSAVATPSSASSPTSRTRHR